MDDADRMRLHHALERLEHVSDSDVRRQTMGGLALEQLRQVFAVEQLEDHVRVTQLLVDVVDADHVLVLDVGRRAPLVDEALGGLRVARVGEHDLDGDGLRELDVLRRENGAHPTLPEQPLEDVLARNRVPRTGQSRGHRGCDAHVWSRIGLPDLRHKRARVIQSSMWATGRGLGERPSCMSIGSYAWRRGSVLRSRRTSQSPACQ